MRKGMREVLPGCSFSGLSAEDFKLLLCGCPHIDVDVVRGITLFHDESRKSNTNNHTGNSVMLCAHVYKAQRSPSMLNFSFQSIL